MQIKNSRKRSCSLFFLENSRRERLHSKPIWHVLPSDHGIEPLWGLHGMLVGIIISLTDIWSLFRAQTMHSTAPHILRKHFWAGRSEPLSGNVLGWITGAKEVTCVKPIAPNRGRTLKLKPDTYERASSAFPFAASQHYGILAFLNVFLKQKSYEHMG